MSENERNAVPCSLISLLARFSQSDTELVSVQQAWCFHEPNSPQDSHEIDPGWWIVATKKCVAKIEFFFSHSQAAYHLYVEKQLRQLTQKLLQSILTHRRSISSSSWSRQLSTRISVQKPLLCQVPYPPINISNKPNRNRNSWNKLDIQQVKIRNAVDLKKNSWKKSRPKCLRIVAIQVDIHVLPQSNQKGWSMPTWSLPRVTHGEISRCFCKLQRNLPMIIEDANITGNGEKWWRYQTKI